MWRSKGWQQQAAPAEATGTAAAGEGGIPTLALVLGSGPAPAADVPLIGSWNQL